MTKNREVAMQYAASGGRGIVFEIQQGMVDRGANDADGKNDKKKSSRYSQSKAKTTRGVGGCWSRGFGPDLNKKRFALGTLIGEVKIPVTGLTPGETSDPMWLPIAPVRSDASMYLTFSPAGGSQAVFLVTEW